MTLSLSLRPAMSFAVLMLATVPALAAPASTEREATRQLNIQASEKAALTRAPVTDRGARNAENAPPAAAPTMAVQSAPQGTGSVPVSGILSGISNPPAKIATASVADSGGQAIGVVQRIEVTETGTPTRVIVGLTTAKAGDRASVVMLDAASVSYDGHANVITTQASAAQLRAMASAG